MKPAWMKDSLRIQLNSSGMTCLSTSRCLAMEYSCLLLGSLRRVQSYIHYVQEVCRYYTKFRMVTGSGIIASIFSPLGRVEGRHLMFRRHASSGNSSTSSVKMCLSVVWRVNLRLIFTFFSIWKHLGILYMFSTSMGKFVLLVKTIYSLISVLTSFKTLHATVSYGEANMVKFLSKQSLLNLLNSLTVVKCNMQGEMAQSSGSDILYLGTNCFLCFLLDVNYDNLHLEFLTGLMYYDFFHYFMVQDLKVCGLLGGETTFITLLDCLLKQFSVIEKSLAFCSCCRLAQDLSLGSCLYLCTTKSDTLSSYSCSSIWLRRWATCILFLSSLRMESSLSMLSPKLGAYWWSEICLMGLMQSCCGEARLPVFEEMLGLLALQSAFPLSMFRQIFLFVWPIQDLRSTESTNISLVLLSSFSFRLCQKSFLLTISMFSSSRLILNVWLMLKLGFLLIYSS